MSNPSFIDLKKVLGNFRDLFVEWFLAAIHPLNKCQSLLAITDEREKWDSVFRLCLTSFLVALVITLPIYHPYGIELSSIGFHLYSFACLTFTMCACGFAVRLGLVMYGIKCRFSDAMAVYVACVLCYQPIVSALSYFEYLHLFSLLASAKRRGLELDEMLRFVIRSATATRSSGFIEISTAVCSWLLLTVLCISSALMAITVAESFSVSRLKSFSAFAFSMTILVPPILAMQGLLAAFAVYVFMQVGSVGAPS